MDPLGTGCRLVLWLVTWLQPKLVRDPEGAEPRGKGLGGVRVGCRVGSNPIPGFVPHIQDDLGSLMFLKCEIQGTVLAHPTAD